MLLGPNREAVGRLEEPVGGHVAVVWLRPAAVHTVFLSLLHLGTAAVTVISHPRRLGEGQRDGRWGDRGHQGQYSGILRVWGQGERQQVRESLPCSQSAWVMASRPAEYGAGRDQQAVVVTSRCTYSVPNVYLAPARYFTGIVFLH